MQSINPSKWSVLRRRAFKGCVQNERGVLLIATTLVLVVIIALTTAFLRWTTNNAKFNTHTRAMQNANYNAESGVNAAMDWLRSPAASTLSTTPVEVHALTLGATYYVSLHRDATDNSIIILTSTGYIYTPGAQYVDPHNGQKGDRAVVDAQLKMEFVGDYFALTPGELRVANGSNLSNGKIYGKSLVFESGNRPTTVTYSYFFNSSTILTPNPNLSFGTPANPPLRISTEPTIPRLANMQDYYYDLANDPTGPCLFAPGDILDDAWSLPAPMNTYNVCYAQGDLHIGSAALPYHTHGKFVVYVAGKTFLDNNIYAAAPVANPLDWVAILSKDDIVVKASPPVNMEIDATLFSDGMIAVLGMPRNTGHLVVKGGLIAYNGIYLASFRAQRDYIYQAPPQSLELPFFVQVQKWKVSQGHYN